jgi:hypothetical protein
MAGTKGEEDTTAAVSGIIWCLYTVHTMMTTMTMMTVETPEEMKPLNKNVLRSTILIPANATDETTIITNRINADARKNTIMAAAAAWSIIIVIVINTANITVKNVTAADNFKNPSSVGWVYFSKNPYILVKGINISKCGSFRSRSWNSKV